VELEDSLQMYFQIDLITDELKHLMKRAMLNVDHLQSQINLLSLGHLSPCTAIHVYQVCAELPRYYLGLTHCFA
jgi:hypothetical protein